MSEKSNSGRISIANILALLGIAALGVTTFFGIYLNASEVKLGTAAILAVLFVIGLTVFIFLAVIAKQKDEESNKWKVVEISCILCYLALAILFSLPSRHFISILTQKTELQKNARQNIDEIRTMVDDYNKELKTHLNNATQQLHACEDAGRYADSDLTTFWDNNIKDIEFWQDDVEIDMRMEIASLDSLESAINKWNLLKLPSLIKTIEDVEAQTRKAIAEKKEIYKDRIPSISGGSGTIYRMNGYVSWTNDTKRSADFTENLLKVNDNTVLGFVVYILLHLIVLLNYLVTPRAYGTRIKFGSSEIGGLEL